MENAGEWEVEQVINVLLEGQNWARQLLQLKSPPSEEQLAMIAQRIAHSFSKSLSMLNCADRSVEHTSNVLNSAAESPLSVDGDVSPMSKKRKMLPKRAERIRVCPSTGMEAPMDDGYSWRKYGQKDILGAKHPRGYFRCTHKNTQGCQATKQVQRSDEDPTIFDVIYKGHHTCTQAAHAKARPLTHSPEQQANDRKQILLSFGNGLHVKTEDSGDTHNLNPPAHFSFPPASMESIKHDGDIFSCIENPFIGSFSPASFISPETSESNYFCFNGGPTSESELTEIISASTSVANSPMLDFDSFSLDVNFSFDDATFLA